MNDIDIGVCAPGARNYGSYWVADIGFTLSLTIRRYTVCDAVVIMAGSYGVREFDE